MDIILSNTGNKIINWINGIYDEPHIFVPNKKLNFIENKNAILKYLTYTMILILLIKRHIPSAIVLCVGMVFVEIIGTNINNYPITSSFGLKSSTGSFDKNSHIKSSHIKSSNNGTCRKSTIDNPMGNVLLYTPVSEQNMSFCEKSNPTNIGMSGIVNTNLTHNVYFNEKDLFYKKENMRPFITMPSQTNPNNIGNFKKYLYDFNNSTCKIDQTNCMFNEDVRYHKTHFVE
jgi:hypothetical protein